MNGGFDLIKWLEVTGGTTAALMPLIMGFVTWVEKFGISGRAQLATSLLTGFVIGGAVQLALFGVPTDLAGIVFAVLAALMPGLAASGVYNTGKKLTASS